MTSIDLIASELTGSLEWLKKTLDDFSDAELMTRPCAGANHPAWQIGHLIAGEVMMVNMIKPGTMPELPAGFADRYDKKHAASDDPKQFPAKKQELLDLFTRVRAATIAFTKSLKPEDLDKDGPEFMRKFCPKVADMLMLQAGHIGMHMGQIQVARRKLGKPVLF